jgi:hypothetical protein
MRNAPAARVTCTTGGWWRAFEALLHAAASAAFVAWAALHAGFPGVTAASGATAAGASVALVAWGLLPAKKFVLQWDGSAWSAAPEGVLLPAPQVQMDLGSALLLRLGGDAPARWAWVSSGGADAAAGCAALHASRTPAMA